MIARILNPFCLIALLFASGCAVTAPYTSDFREGLVRTDYEGVLLNLNRARKGPNRLLYLLEKGLIDHYRGDYRKSNLSFEQAERLTDRLFTRSLSREVASLLTSDAVRPYRGEAFELIFIHYYRALNYWRLGLPEDALVECRKANLRLARYAPEAGGEAAYRNDAFIHYMTGLFYEATGELNDAYVSYQDAQRAYQAYSKTFGVSLPPPLADDLARVAGTLGYDDETETLLASLDPNVNPEITPAILSRAPFDTRPPLDTGPAAPTRGNGRLSRVANEVSVSRDGELVLFCETGFVPHKVQEEINLPIYDSDLRRGREIGLSVPDDDARKGFEGDIRAFSRQIAARHQAVYPADLRLKYWLRVALPAYREAPIKTRCLRLTASGQSARTVLAEDLSAIARRTFEEKRPAVLARTIVRGVSKYLATEAVEEKNKYLGFLANLFTASTEVADTRGWLSLPHSIQIGRLRLPAGVHDLTVESVDAEGQVVETKLLRGVEVRAGERTFLSCRTYE